MTQTDRPLEYGRTVAHAFRQRCNFNFVHLGAPGSLIHIFIYLASTIVLGREIP